MDKEINEMGNTGSLRGYIHTLVYFRRSMLATHLAHGEGKIDLIGVDPVELSGPNFPPKGMP